MSATVASSVAYNNRQQLTTTASSSLIIAINLLRCSLAVNERCSLIVRSCLFCSQPQLLTPNGERLIVVRLSIKRMLTFGSLLLLPPVGGQEVPLATRMSVAPTVVEQAVPRAVRMSVDGRCV